MRIERTKPSLCPNCGKLHDAATPIRGRRGPKPGDVALCLGCGHICIVGDDNSLRNPNDAEIVEIAGHPDIIIAQKRRAAFHAKNPAKESDERNRNRRRAEKVRARR